MSGGLADSLHFLVHRSKHAHRCYQASNLFSHAGRQPSPPTSSSPRLMLSARSPQHTHSFPLSFSSQIC